MSTRYCDDDNQTDQRVLPVGVHPAEHEAVSDDLDQRGTDNGADRSAATACEVGPADHGSGDDTQFVAARQVRRRRTEPSGQQDARCTRGEAAQDVGADFDPIYAHPRPHRGLFTAADREQMAAPDGVVKAQSDTAAATST